MWQALEIPPLIMNCLNLWTKLSGKRLPLYFYWRYSTHRWLYRFNSRFRSFENDLFKDNRPSKPLYENSLCTDIHTLTSWEALLRPTSDGLDLTRQLEALQKLKGYSATQLYCEILRACCLGLAETADSPGEHRWAVFTFLKVPSLLLRLHRSIHGNSPFQKIVSFSITSL